MKRILITGANSFIGTSFENFIRINYPDKYLIDTIDLEDKSWKDNDFSIYDTVFHVAGIAHSDNGRISAETEKTYYSVNTYLAIETAQKAKSEGVSQFIFMSSAIVYGESSAIGKSKIITAETPVSPVNSYGDSKLQAEIGLRKLNDECFKVVVLRPPMIYGKGCKGNYLTLVKIAKILPFFPYVENVRSMLYIDNLSEFVRLMIDNQEEGIFHPQNQCYSNTSELVQIIAKTYGKKLRLVKGFTWALKILGHISGIVNKAFGSLAYDMKISEYKYPYRIVPDLTDSIKLTEGKN